MFKYRHTRGLLRRPILLLLVALSLLVFSLGATRTFASTPTDSAQALGSAPIRIVIPFGPGSGTDFYARLLAQHLSESLSTQVLIVNRPGANGAIAAEFVANAKPDGTTFLMTSNTAVAANPSLMKNLNYDPVKDFTPITRLGNLTFFIVVTGDSPYKTMDDLIAAARQNPDKISYGTANSLSIVSGAKISKSAGVEMLAVNYKNPPQILTDLLGGRLSFAFVDMATAAPFSADGKMRPLAVLADKRFPLLADVPSMPEVGFKDFNVLAWFGLFGPAGTPPAIVNQLNQEVNAILAKPDFRERTAAVGLDVFGSSAEDLGVYLKDQIALWRELVADAGLQPE